MASLVERNNRFCVVYTYENDAGEKKQKWETYKTKSEALRRKSEIEYRQELCSVVIYNEQKVVAKSATAF